MILENDLNGTQPHIRLSILITVYSEETTLERTIRELEANNRGYIHEIILIVCPQSSTRCLDICRSLDRTYSRVSFHLQETTGVGRAVREGMSIAVGNYIAIMSGDLETNPETIDRMVKTIEETNCQVVIANRWMKGGGFRNYDPLKLALNWLFQHIFKRVYATDISDLTFGYKILKKDLADSIQWESVLHEIFIETTLKPLLQNASVCQVPTVWTKREEGLSKNSFFINFRYVGLAIRLIRYIPGQRQKKNYEKKPDKTITQPSQVK